MTTPRRILLLGGTGFLGPHLVDAARARGHAVTLFHRGKTRPELFPDVERILGNRDGGLAALGGGRWDAVVDTSGYVPRIVRASAQALASVVDHHVFISSISVYSDVSRPGLDESTPVETLSEPGSEDVRKDYGALKALCEKAVEETVPGRAAIIRPGLIAGPGDPTDRFTYWPVRLVRGGEVLAPGSGDDPAQLIDARDLAEWIVTVVEQRIVGTFNATGPASPLTAREMLEACRRATGSDARLTWVGASWLEAHGVAPWSDLPAWLPATGETAGFAAVSCRRALDCGLRFRPLEETAKDTLAWFSSLPDERRARPKAGLAPGRELELLAEWHARA